jgi:hypothetical protein
MRKSRLIPASLAATLSVAALAGPAAAASHTTGPPTWPAHPKPITAYAPQLPSPPTWPTNPKPITEYRSSVQATDGGFDWDSAGIGAAASLAALGVGVAGVAGVRRRRHARAHALIAS